MKLLMLFQTSPYPPDLGPSKRNTPFFLENLKRHEVSVLAFGTEEEHRKFSELYGKQCKHIVFVNNKRPRAINFLLRIWRLIRGHNSLRWLYHRKMARELKRLLAQERFDLIHCCDSLYGYYELPTNIPIVGDAHNVAFDFSRRTYEREKNPLLKLYWYLDYLYMKREDVETTDKFDVVLACTDIDREKMEKAFPNKRFVTIPNGVDPAFFEPQNVAEEPKSMVFTGLMSYQPNYQGVTYFLDEIFPLILEKEPEARLYVVGALPPKQLQRRARNNVIVTGWVDDVKPYFAKGQVFVIPLLVGGGIRGKALEAMAMKRPIVTTTIGCEGINLQHMDSALFADDPKAFAEAVLRLFNDAELRNRLTAKAYKNVVEGYSWETNGLVLEKLYQSLRKLHGSNGAGIHNASQAQTLQQS